MMTSIPVWVALLVSLGGFMYGAESETFSSNIGGEEVMVDAAQETSIDPFLVDEILVTIYHADGAEIITKSDVEHVLLGGGIPSLRDKILEELMILDAKKIGISISREDAEDFMAKLQKTRGVSRYEMMRMFQEFGYSFDEGLEALRRRQIVEQIMDFRVRSDKRVVVQKEELLAYAKENPRYTEPAFVLAQVVLSDEDVLTKDFSCEELHALPWEDSFVIGDSELPEDKLFLRDAAVGTVVGREPFEEGVEITRLIEKRERIEIPAEDRFDEIASILGQQRFAMVMQEYQQMLLDSALLDFTYTTDREAIFGAEENLDVVAEAAPE